EGTVPTPIDPPKGCRFHPRCRYRMPVCEQEEPDLLPAETQMKTGEVKRSTKIGKKTQHLVRCHLHMG
ncbi:MAG TPA: hypothetical protein PK183_10505, partial [Bacillota bacterium]|nr:hypothetical protein [Bacillota bacterium]